MIGSGAKVQSVSRCLLVVLRALPSRWNHLNREVNSSHLQQRRRRDTCVVLDFSPRSTQKATLFEMSETT